MSIRGFVTSTGLSKTIEAAKNEGWYIAPKKFALSSSKGELIKSRSLVDLEIVWYENWISGREVRAPESVIFLCTVPPEQAQSLTEVNEIYLIAEDSDGEDFLLFFGQPDEPITYDPNGTLRLRLQVTLANVNIGAIYQFIYTQAQEIESHNADPNAHEDIINRFIRMGYPISDYDHVYKGQLLDEQPKFNAAITHGKILYYDSQAGEYNLAIANNTYKDRAVGFAEIGTLLQVVSGGYLQTNLNSAPYNFPNDAVFYLSATDPGEPTLTRTDISMGVHISNGVCYIPPAPGIMKYAGIGGSGGFSGTPVYTKVDITARPNDHILADLSDNSVIVTLPNNPRLGDSVKVTDVAGNAEFNNLIVKGQGALINRIAEDLLIDVNKAVIFFTYFDVSNNWLIDLGGSRFSGYLE